MKFETSNGYSITAIVTDNRFQFATMQGHQTCCGVMELYLGGYSLNSLLRYRKKDESEETVTTEIKGELHGLVEKSIRGVVNVYLRLLPGDTDNCQGSWIPMFEQLGFKKVSTFRNTNSGRALVHMQKIKEEM